MIIARTLTAAVTTIVVSAMLGEQPALCQTVPPLQSAQAIATRVVAPPPGFVSFCMHNLSLCVPNRRAQVKLVLDQKTFSQLTAVNLEINREIAYAPDPQHFGIANVWRLDAVGGEGDCKDYALAKQQMLIGEGVPASALRIAIARTELDELHAVLTVDTDRGDFVLDNRTPEIKRMSDVRYKWIMLQSASDPLRWEHIASDASGDQ